jgi:pilus assembly protein CpaF
MVMMGDVGLPLGAIREQLVSALDLIVHVARRPDGSRAIVATAEVTSDSRRVRLLADDCRVVAAPERQARR